MSQLLEKPAVDTSDTRLEQIELLYARDPSAPMHPDCVRDLLAIHRKRQREFERVSDDLNASQSERQELERELKASDEAEQGATGGLNIIREATEGLLPTFSRLRDDPLLFAQDVRELLRRVPA